MKKLFIKLLNRLNGIGKDKYQHVVLGAVLAAAAFLAPRWIGAVNWLALFVSFTVVLGAALYKEYRLDPTPDTRDLLATILGGAVVWVAVLSA